MTAPENVIKYASLVFAVTYIGIGITVLLNSNSPVLITILNGWQIPFGIVFILYGLFRGFRIFQRLSS